MSNPTEVVDMTHARVICGQHGEPFRTEWPRGYLIFSTLIMKALLNRDDFLEEARKVTGTPAGEDIPVKAIEKVLDVRPACCRVSKPMLVRLLEESRDDWPQKRCNNCRRKRPGAPYSTQTQKFEHMCFDCVVSAMVYSQ